jgi:hypothetical protein
MLPVLTGGKLLEFRSPLPHYEGYSLGIGEDCVDEAEAMRFVHIRTLMGFLSGSFILFIRSMEDADWPMDV